MYSLTMYLSLLIAALVRRWFMGPLLFLMFVGVAGELPVLVPCVCGGSATHACDFLCGAVFRCVSRQSSWCSTSSSPSSGQSRRLLALLALLPCCLADPADAAPVVVAAVVVPPGGVVAASPRDPSFSSWLRSCAVTRTLTSRRRWATARTCSWGRKSRSACPCLLASLLLCCSLLSGAAAALATPVATPEHWTDVTHARLVVVPCVCVPHVSSGTY